LCLHLIFKLLEWAQIKILPWAPLCIDTPLFLPYRAFARVSYI